MSQAESRPTGKVAAPHPASTQAPSLDNACHALRLNGIALSEEDLALTVAEFERALEIVGPLLEYPLPDGLDQAGIYRP